MKRVLLHGLLIPIIVFFVAFIVQGICINIKYYDVYTSSYNLWGYGLFLLLNFIGFTIVYYIFCAVFFSSEDPTVRKRI